MTLHACGRFVGAASLVVVSAVLLGCGALSPPVSTPLSKEQLVAVTAGHELITFNAAKPEQILERRPVKGLLEGERIVGIDFRVAKGVLYALSQHGRLFSVDIPSGVLTQVGSPSAELRLQGPVFGFDFNPAADRIRVVSSGGQNLRLHPDTGAIVDGDPGTPGVQPDPALRYAWSDVNAGRQPDIAGAAYTYNPKDSKITTNYAIDRKLGVLVMQGSKEGVQPVVSPNSGQLRTVGSLGLGVLADVAFDISDVNNSALAALRTSADSRTSLYQIDLGTGQARLLGVIGSGEPLAGMGIEP